MRATSLISHLLDHPLGLVHVLFALTALLFGSIVVFKRKGNRSHRWLGRSYVAAMVALNLSALLDYELYGRFGPFHWMALLSLVTVVAGFRAARIKQPHWKFSHAYFMAGSYVGLLAATAAEIATRVPAWSFGPAVIISSAVVILFGVIVMMRLIPRAM